MPMAIATSRYMAFNSWSRMTVNLPWSDMGFAIGAVVHVPRDANAEQLEACRQAVERSLNAVTALAYDRAGADPGARHAERLASRRPGLRLKAYRSLTALARPAGAVHAQAARSDAARRRRRGCPSAWGSPARRVRSAGWSGCMRRASARRCRCCR